MPKTEETEEKSKEEDTDENQKGSQGTEVSKDTSSEEAEQKTEKPSPPPPPRRYQGRYQRYGGGDEYVRVRTPNKPKGEMFALADQLLGASRIRVLGGDGKARMGRIPGKLRKRMWIRQGDLLIIRPWEFQQVKADIVWRYTKTQAISLAKKKLLPEVINIF